MIFGGYNKHLANFQSMKSFSVGRYKTRDTMHSLNDGYIWDLFNASLYIER